MARLPLAPEADPVVAAWLERLNLIQDDIQELLFRRLIFRRLREIVEANPRLHRPSLLYTYLTSTYAASSAAGVRRHARQDDQRRDASLIGLLFDIRRTPEVLTRSRHVAMYAVAGVPQRASLRPTSTRSLLLARPISSVNMYSTISMPYRALQTRSSATPRSAWHISTESVQRTQRSPSWTWRSMSLNGSSDAMSCCCAERATPFSR